MGQYVRAPECLSHLKSKYLYRKMPAFKSIKLVVLNIQMLFCPKTLTAAPRFSKHQYSPCVSMFIFLRRHLDTTAATARDFQAFPPSLCYRLSSNVRPGLLWLRRPTQASNIGAWDSPRDSSGPPYILQPQQMLAATELRPSGRLLF